MDKEMLYALLKGKSGQPSSGSSIVLKGKDNDKFSTLSVYGRSAQATTSGAQLLDLTDVVGKTESKNGFTYRVNSDESISVSGVPTEYTSFFLKQITLKAGKYCWKNYVENKSIFIQLISSVNIPTNGCFTLDSNSDISVYVVANVMSGNTEEINLTFNAMLNTGDVLLPWEPYTGGIPSPNPDYPQEIKAVDNPTVAISDKDGTESQLITFPYTLNAIPVSAGGNYTDENGQQYVADYVDMERGKLVRCVYEIEVNGEDKSFVQENQYCSYSARKLPNAKEKGNEAIYSLSSFFSEPAMFNSEFGLLYVTKKDYAQVLNDSAKNKTGHITYALATPIENDLTADEIATYKALHTYPGTTVVDNDAGAYMRVAIGDALRAKKIALLYGD